MTLSSFFGLLFLLSVLFVLFAFFRLVCCSFSPPKQLFLLDKHRMRFFSLLGVDFYAWEVPRTPKQTIIMGALVGGTSLDGIMRDSKVNFVWIQTRCIFEMC